MNNNMNRNVSSYLKLQFSGLEEIIFEQTYINSTFMKCSPYDIMHRFLFCSELDLLTLIRDLETDLLNQRIS